LKTAKLEAENDALRRVVAGLQVVPGSHATASSDLPAPLVALSASTGAAAKPPISHKLSEALPVWQRLKNPARSTIEIYQTAVQRFENRFPNVYVENVEKRHIRDFVAWMQAEGKSGKTIEKEHGAIRALLGIAQHEEWVASNAASGILLPSTKGKKVRSYSIEECQRVFDSPVFTQGSRPTGCKGEAAYWIPLLLLFTGARREELAQLTVDRVKSVDGVPYLAIDPIDEDGALKTEESKRAVPIHRELLRLGFLDFVQKRRDAGGKQVFDELKANKRQQYGAKWGDWWGRYVRETVGLTDKNLHPAHSFRHLFITECRRLHFRDDYERAIVGHTRGGRKDAHDGYGEHLVPALADLINQVDFRGLDLSKIRKA
jgi:integrase